MRKAAFAIMLLAMCGPAAEAKSHRHKGGKYAMNEQMQQLLASQKAERQACKREGGAGCADLKQRQREQRKELKQALSGRKK